MTAETESPERIYKGPIEVGMSFVWMPNHPTASQVVTVTAITFPKNDEPRIWTGDEIWNDEGRWREACVPVTCNCADLTDAKDKRIAELEEECAAAWDKCAERRIAQEAAEADLATATDGLRKCEEEIDGYIGQEYPGEHPVQARYRARDFAANPARTTLEEIKGSD